MTNPASRLITLIMLLQRQPNQKASDLAQALGVSVRTVHRYIETLEDMGIPIYAERGPHGGFSLVRGYKMPPLVFSPDEAAALCLGTNLVIEMWGELYQAPAHSALAKLQNVLPLPQVEEISRVQATLVAMGMGYVEPTRLYPQLQILRTATQDQRRVTLSYHSASGTTTERPLDPYAIVHQHGWWYVVGFCHLRKDLRTFRIDRIESVSVSEDRFDRPSDFDVRAFLESAWDSPGLIQARLRFSPDASQTVNAYLIYWDSAQVNADGSTDVSITATDLNWLAAFVLGFAHWVTVLEPPELRQQVKLWAERTAALYNKTIKEN
jgi:predicted DNA-binding transcriptional regulator YafY